VLLIDRRNHIGGNAYDEKDEAGILYHKYGPHIFHTNSDMVVDYLSQFTSGGPTSIACSPASATSWCRSRSTGRPSTLFAATSRPTRRRRISRLARRAGRGHPTSEDVVINAVGRELYELFFRGYTRKQWGLDPSELDKQVTSRIPTRTNTDDRYFGDKFQAMPLRRLHGDVRADARPSADRKSLGTDFRDLRDEADEIADHIVYTGPIDEYFDFRFGKLPYRSLKFDHQTLDQEQFQPVAVVNYPSPDVPYTRISEYKHLTGQSIRAPAITYEYPSAEGDPYYPIPRPENQELFKRYEALADETKA
jgi:UDP-galactopyranose mutase